VEKTKRFSISLPVDLHRKFKLACVSSDKVMGDYLRDLLVRDLDRQDIERPVKTARRGEARA
jgi:hypothetical protein